MVVAAVIVAWWTTGRGGIEVDGPVVSHSNGWFGGGDSMDAIVGGTLSYEDGCLLLDGSAVLWPGGTSWDDGRQVLVLPDDTEVAPGDGIHGGGGMALEEPVDDSQLDSPAAKATAGCRAEGASLVVFNADSDLEVS